MSALVEIKTMPEREIVDAIVAHPRTSAIVCGRRADSLRLMWALGETSPHTRVLIVASGGSLAGVALDVIAIAGEPDPQWFAADVLPRLAKGGLICRQEGAA